MLERFDANAIKTIMLAQEESRRLGHNFVGTEQILLGIIAEGLSVASASLRSFGVSLKDARIEVEKIIGRGSGFVAVEIPLTPKARKALELASDEASKLGANSVSPGHLLLGLLQVEDGTACLVLSLLEVNFSHLRQDVINAMQLQTTSKLRSSIRTPNLDLYGVDLTKGAIDGHLDPVIGREEEIDHVIRILSRRTRRNPLLTGESGVGKSAIVAGLATRIAEADVPDKFLNKRIVRIDIPFILLQTEWVVTLNNCLLEAMKAKIILQIDELHSLLLPQSVNASCLIAWFLKSTSLCCIGIAPVAAVYQGTRKDDALFKHFQPLLVHPATIEETVLILRGLRSNLEAYHQVAISDESIDKAVLLSDKYITERRLPVKAIDVIEEACTLARMRAGDLAPVDLELRRIRRQRDECRRKQDFGMVEILNQQESSIIAAKQTTGVPAELPIVQAEHVLQALSEWPNLLAENPLIN